MLVALVTIVGLIIADQGLKFWVVSNLALGSQIKLIPGYFSLTYVQNRGAS